jgi:hypothetical protein
MINMRVERGYPPPTHTHTHTHTHTSLRARAARGDIMGTATKQARAVETGTLGRVLKEGQDLQSRWNTYNPECTGGNALPIGTFLPPNTYITPFASSTHIWWS